MSRCLCCGKELRNGNEYGWHSACVKSFFGMTKFPDIDVSKETLNQIALDTTGKGFTVPGVQKKVVIASFKRGESSVDACELSDRIYP